MCSHICSQTHCLSNFFNSKKPIWRRQHDQMYDPFGHALCLPFSTGFSSPFPLYLVLGVGGEHNAAIHHTGRKGRVSCLLGPTLNCTRCAVHPAQLFGALVKERNTSITESKKLTSRENWAKAVLDAVLWEGSTDPRTMVYPRAKHRPWRAFGAPAGATVGRGAVQAGGSVRIRSVGGSMAARSGLGHRPCRLSMEGVEGEC